METLNNDFSIINADIAVATLPTAKTLRIAKALGYAAVLHDHSDGPTISAEARDDLCRRVEAGRLGYHATALEARQGPAEVEALIASLPKPMLVVSRDPRRTALLLIAATRLEGRDGRGDFDPAQPSHAAHAGSRAA